MADAHSSTRDPLPQQTEKTCSVCGKSKPLDEFRPRHRKCKKCLLADQRNRYSADKERSIKEREHLREMACSYCGESKSPDAFYPRHRRCKECFAALRRESYRANRESRIEASFQWRIANLEHCKARDSKRYRLHRERILVQCRTNYAKHKVRKRAEQKLYRTKRRFQVALWNSINSAKAKGHVPCTASLEEITQAFTGYCQNPACQQPEGFDGRKLHLDHNHDTGQFRGWLCQGCNHAIGMTNESAEKLISLATYLLHFDTADKAE